MNEKTKVDGGGNVYPFHHEFNEVESVYNNGITRRDWLAGLAMQGMLADGEMDNVINRFAENLADHALDGKDLKGGVNDSPLSDFAKKAYQYADAMIAESNK